MGLNGNINKMQDKITPAYYRKSKIECIDAIKAATIGKSGINAVCTANVIKYLWRFEEKGGIEDVKKAQWYLKKLLDELNHEHQTNPIQ